MSFGRPLLEREPTSVTPRPFNLEKTKMWALVAGSSALSVGGVAVAALVTADPVDGGRGGALAVALTLVAFFLRKDVNEKLRLTFTRTLPELRAAIDEFSGAPEREKTKVPAAGPIVTPTQRLDAIETSLRVTEQSEQRMDRYVAAAAVIGTLFWGFGDIVAKWFLP